MCTKAAQANACIDLIITQTYIKGSMKYTKSTEKEAGELYALEKGAGATYNATELIHVVLYRGIIDID